MAWFHKVIVSLSSSSASPALGWKLHSGHHLSIPSSCCSVRKIFTWRQTVFTWHSWYLSRKFHTKGQVKSDLYFPSQHGNIQTLRKELWPIAVWLKLNKMSKVQGGSSYYVSDRALHSSSDLCPNLMYLALALSWPLVSTQELWQVDHYGNWRGLSGLCLLALGQSLLLFLLPWLYLSFSKEISPEELWESPALWKINPKLIV